MNIQTQRRYLEDGSLQNLLALTYRGLWSTSAFPDDTYFMYLHGINCAHRKFYTGITELVRSKGESSIAARYIEHFEAVVLLGTSLRAKVWRPYPFWAQSFLPVYHANSRLVKRRETFSHRCYQVPTVADSVQHRESMLPQAAGVSRNGPEKDDGCTLFRVHRKTPPSKSIRQHRKRVPWDEHLRWNADHFLLHPEREQEWERVAAGAIPPLAGEWSYLSYPVLLQRHSLGLSSTPVSPGPELYDAAYVHVLAAAICDQHASVKVEWGRISDARLYVLANLIKCKSGFRRRQYGRQRLSRTMLRRKLPPLTMKPLQVHEDGDMTSTVAGSVLYAVSIAHMLARLQHLPPAVALHFRAAIAVTRKSAPSFRRQFLHHIPAAAAMPTRLIQVHRWANPLGLEVVPGRPRRHPPTGQR